MTPEASVPVEQSYALSAMQGGMLFHRLRSPRSGVDIEQMVASLKEHVDPDALERAWAHVIAQHPVLRTRIRWEGLESPVQEVLRATFVRLDQEDLRALDEASRSRRLAAFLRDDRIRGIDLDRAPSMRLRLFRLGDDDHRLVWTFPHLLLDGTSFPRVVEDVFKAYEAIRRGERPAHEASRPYGDHIGWLSRHLAGRSAEAARFWRETLAGFQAANTLPRAEPDGGAPPADRLHDRCDARLSVRETAALRDLARAHGVPPSTLVQAAWGLCVGDFSGDADVVVGVVRACRRSALPEAQGMVGLFINTLPLRLPPQGDEPLGSWLREVRARDVAMRPFEHTPLAEVQAASELVGDRTLFHSVIVFNKARMGRSMRALGGPWNARDFEWIEQTSFPLTLFAHAEPELELSLCWDPSRVTAGAAHQMMARLREALIAMATHPDARVADLPRIPLAETERVATWNATARPFREAACVHELIEEAAERRPDAVAVVFGDQQISYRALDARADDLARRLEALGVGPDVRVGIFVERSIEMVIGLLGILKSGGAYVPLDPSYPAARIAMMLEDACAPVIVSQRRLAARLPPGDARVVLLEDAGGAPEGDAPRVVSGVTSSHLAYVIFTSGSTGRPKGVMVEHRNVANFFAGMDERLGTEPGVWLAVTSISFDISVLELLWTLSRGYEVVIQEEGTSAALEARAATPVLLTARMDFSLFYFASDGAASASGRYRLLLEGAKYADRHGFSAIWTPERHFHAFGGLYPNPSLTSAAIAVLTERIQIRAGSVVLPLHDPIRVAEEWSVVDNLSGGRVGLSFASGWHADDFVLAPDHYEPRRELMWSGIETIRALWAGEPVTRRNGKGAEIEVRLHPAPIQKSVPLWIATAGSPDTFRAAGEAGANILTNLLGQSREQLAEKIRLYRGARRERGHEGPGHVSLMLHTHVGEDVSMVRETVRKPFTDYLRSSTELIQKAAWSFPAFADSAASGADLDGASSADMDALMAHAFERYFETHGLFGTPSSCLDMVTSLQAIGVDEIACLIDFGVAEDEVLGSLPHLDRLRRMSAGAEPRREDASIAAQILRRGATHMQCTPSLARALLEDPAARDALGSLTRLLLGGEPLPEALAEDLHRRLRPGALLNMYGPTETTVWSSSAVVAAGEPVTIGSPLANTSLFVLDPQMRSAPPGVVGELCIGGAGVARGYLGRPDLTAERFVNSPFAAHERLYRTGDMARRRADGALEILGRVDQQVKLRGHRIELGEIESVLGQHRAVRESAVVARRNARGEDELVAHVVPATDEGESAARGAGWTAMWDVVYGSAPAEPPAAPGGEAEAGLNLAGWSSSYTGEAMPQHEMREWVSATASQILELQPRRVLEIGCGTGLLLLRVAPHIERYVGVDASAAALSLIEARLRARPMRHVSLLRASADDLSDVPEEAFDTIVVNSVVQYFPDVSYLLRVLGWALEHLAPGGAILVGDVRSLPLLEAFHTSIELHRAPPSMPREELQERVRSRLRKENELVVDPALFEAFARTHAEVADVVVTLKRGRSVNEMTGFRYDVILRKCGPAGGPASHSPAPARTLSWSESWSELASESASEVKTVEDVRAELRRAPGALRIVALPNARLSRDLRATALLAAPDGARTAADLRALLDGVGDGPPREAGFEPEDLRTIDPDHHVTLTWTDGDPGAFDALLVPRDPSEKAPSRARAARLDAPAASVPWESWVHRPPPGPPADALVDDLRRHLRARLPEMMIPALVLCAALPRTPNGKIDRAALARSPAVEEKAAPRPRAPSPPEGEIEQKIAGVWRELLGLSEVGRTDSFGDLGASSLVIMAANARIRAALGEDVSLVEMFRFPTIALLAAHLDQRSASSPEGGPSAAEVAADRGKQRRDAMARRQRGATSASRDGSK